MDITAVNNHAAQYYGTAAVKTKTTESKPAGDAQGATVEISGQGMNAYASSQKAETDGNVVVSKNTGKENKTDTTTSDQAGKKDIAATAKMSKEDRAALVKQLKADQAKQTEGLMNIVREMLGQQAQKSTDADGMWKFLASGDYTVDAETKAKAQEAVSENGYYGVKQTSDRLFEFASALAGDDVEKMKKMQSAIQKGYDQATKIWGKELPEITKKTLEAVNKKFDEYYAGKESNTVQTAESAV